MEYKIIPEYKSDYFLHSLSMDLTFNFTGKLFQPQVYNRVVKILKRNISSPIVVEFDPTSNCNQKCTGCISKHLLNKGEFPLSQIIHLVDIFKDIEVKAMVFTGGGEPLLHSNIIEPLFYAKKSGFELGLITNGTLLYKYSFDFSGLFSWLRVSVDAGNPETYSILHYDGTTAYTDIFFRVIKGMEFFAKNKGKIRLGFSFLISPSVSGYSNISEVYNACKLAKEIGCDYFEIKPKVDKSHYSLLTSKKELHKIKRQYDTCKALETEHFSVYCSESLQDFLDKGLLFNKEYIVQHKSYTGCLVSNFRTTVTRRGVFPCPYFRGDTNKGYSFNFKDSYLTTYDFQNILNSINKKVNPTKDCKWYCIRHRQNLTLQLISEKKQNNFQLDEQSQEDQYYDPFI